MRVRVMAFCLMAAVSSSVVAQQAGQAAPSFRAENLYSFGNLDSVAVMQGGLSIQIPIASFGSEIQTSLQLVYQSSGWEALPQSCPPLNNCAQLYPKKQSRAGLGWRVSLGDLYQPSPGGVQTAADLAPITQKAVEEFDFEDTTGILLRCAPPWRARSRKPARSYSPSTCFPRQCGRRFARRTRSRI